MRGDVLRLPVDEEIPEWQGRYIPVNPAWLEQAARVESALGLKARLEQDMRAFRGQDRFLHLIRFIRQEQERNSGRYPPFQESLALMLFLTAGMRDHPDIRPVTLRYYVESLGFGSYEPASVPEAAYASLLAAAGAGPNILHSGKTRDAVSLLAAAAGIRTGEAERAQNREAVREALVRLRRVQHVGNAFLIVTNLTLGFMAMPVIAELKLVGMVLSISQQTFLFLVEYYKATADDRIDGDEWFALILSTFGFIPVMRLQQFLTGLGLALSVAEFFSELEKALGNVEEAITLVETARRYGGAIHAGDRFGRLDGDLLDMLLKIYPDLRDQVGKSTEGEIRAKVLNAVLKTADTQTQVPGVPEAAHSRTFALESLDRKPERNFDGRSASSPFRARETAKMPRAFTYVIRLPEGARPTGHSGHERVIVYMEEKLSVGRGLKEVLGAKTRRPDYVMIRYPVSVDELAAITGSSGDVKPGFRSFLDEARKSGRRVPVANASFKSLDFSTFLFGKKSNLHGEKHVETFAKLVSHLYLKEGLEFSGITRFLLREWYHRSPVVFEREGRASLVLTPKGPDAAGSRLNAHTIELTADISKGRTKWISSPVPPRFLTDEQLRGFRYLASRLRRSLQVVIARAGRP